MYYIIIQLLVNLAVLYDNLIYQQQQKKRIFTQNKITIFFK